MTASTTTSSQAQQIPGMDPWKKLFDEQAARMQAAFVELERLQGSWIAFGKARIDAMSELMKAQMAYGEELASAARRLVADAAKRATDAFPS